MSAEIHTGDIGTLFKVTVKDQDSVVVDLTSATTKNLVFRKPDGTNLTKSGSFFTTGSDGVLTYTTIAADLALAGNWSVQAVVAFPGGGTWSSSMEEFVVHGNL
jgi:hypothetical protein